MTIQPMNKIKCPFCNSKRVAEILYGMPAFSKELEQELKDEKIFLGGCVIHDDIPLFHCFKCGKDWGKNSDSNEIK